MSTLSRTTSALLGLALATALVVTGPATPSAVAAATSSPDWVPVQASVLSSSLSENQKANLAATMNGKISGADWHLKLQTAAAAGAYVPGLSDYAQTHGVSPHAVSPEQASKSYAQYAQRPGSGSLVAAPTNSRGVVTVAGRPGQTGNSVGFLSKGGQTMAGSIAGASVIGGAAALGYSVGKGIASVTGLPTSGSFFCDVAMAFADSSCGIGPAAEYIPNDDVSGMTPGWLAAQNSVSGTWPDGKPAYFSAAVVRSPDFGQRGPAQLIITLDNPRQCANRHDKANVFIYTHSSTSISGTLSLALGCDAWNTNQTQYTYDLSAGVYDHFTLSTLPGSPPSTPTFNTALWYPVGHQKRPADVASDPIRNWVVDWTCTTGPGGSLVSADFQESQAVWPAPPDAKCASGEVSAVTIRQRTAGLGEEIVYQWSLPPETGAFLDKYPQCGNGGCVLDLLTTVTGTEVSCFSSPELCTNWLKSPTRDTDYQCRYAGQDVAISECFLYGPTFNPTQVTNGSPYGDPQTGEPLKPVDAATGAPAPVPGAGTGPAKDPNCPPGFSWGGLFNPWWYYKGVSCALQEAFVPNAAATQQTVNQVNTTLQTRTPFNLLYAIPPVVSSFTEGWSVGCSGMPNFSGIEGLELAPACSPPDSPAWRAAYQLMVISLWGGTAFLAWHMIGRSIGGKE